MCGEKPAILTPWVKPPGSPPRMRGKVQQPQQRGSAPWITPACAGKRTSFTGIQIPVKDHPRVCGEKDDKVYKKQAEKGSPPRMRGKGFAESSERRSDGITPAHAGKRRFYRRYPPQNEDHPRACGEKCFCAEFRFDVVGSPPRVWGKVSVRAAWRPYHGITPACAGKRRVWFSSWPVPWDHPRVCGEKLRHNI